MIDLHLHTTASDGHSTPEALVARAAAVGLATIAVTDHDTMAAVPGVRAAAATAGLRVVSGIEITAVHEAKDVHILGYFIEPGDQELESFLVAQRADRHRRIVEMLERVNALGLSVSESDLPIDPAAPSARALGRPLIASALVSAGHVRDIGEAFDRFLGHGRPAFVPRRGASPRDVVALINRAGGLASFAHPGKLGTDDLIQELARQGLAAIEVFHPDHGAADVEKYRRLSADLGLSMTGGSDYHGPAAGRVDALGTVVLPQPAFAAFEARRAGV